LPRKAKTVNAQPNRKPKLMAETGLIEIDNPYWGSNSPIEHRRVVAVRSLRDDALGQMHDRHQISEPQYRAGRSWQGEYEASGIGRIKAQDTTQEPVDGSRRVASGITDRQQRAMKRLARWKSTLGPSGWQLTSMILGDKRSTREATLTIYGEASPANLKFVGRRFRECLDELARDLGLVP